MIKRSFALFMLLLGLAISDAREVVVARSIDQQGPTFIESTDPLSLKSGSPETLHIASTATSLSVSVLPPEFADTKCGGQLSTCAPTDGLLEIEVALSKNSTVDKATLVVIDLATGRRAVRQLKAAEETAKPTQPTKLTVTVTGCESFYRTAFLGCPADTYNTEVGKGLDVAQGTAIVTGERAATGQITLQQCPLKASEQSTTTTSSVDSPCKRPCDEATASTDGATASSADGATTNTTTAATGSTGSSDSTEATTTEDTTPPAATEIPSSSEVAEVAPLSCTIMRVSGFSTFGTFDGTLGSGDGALSLSVKRRAPIVVGYFVLLLGAALAAFVSWLNQVAAFSAIRRKYELAKQSFDEQRALLKARSANLPVDLEAWNIEPAKPTALSKFKQRDSTQVTAWISSSAASTSLWSQRLVPLLDLNDAIQAANGAGTSLAANVATQLPLPSKPFSTDQLVEINNVKRALVAGTPALKAVLLASADIATAVGHLGHEWPEAGHADLVGDEPKQTTSKSVVRPAAIAFAVVSIGIVLLSVGLDYHYDHSRNWLIALTLGVVFGAGAVAVVVGVMRRGWSVLVAAVIGWMLAALFGGGDAIDANNAWGTPADVLKALGIALVGGGTAQLLRFGFPGDKSTT